MKKEYQATNYESDLTGKQFARKEPNYDLDVYGYDEPFR